jgi:hypothetical protein
MEAGCNKRLSNLGRTRFNSMQAIITHGISPLVFSSESLYREVASDTLTDVKISKAKGTHHVILPGMKQRIAIPRDPLNGQTIVLPARFGSVITASSGTSIHWLSMRTR